MGFTEDIEQKLLAPFEPNEIEVREGGGGRKLAYIDARTARRRLTEAAGPGSWSFDWELIDAVPEKYVRVKGTMTVLGVTRCDAGEAQFNPRSADLELVKAAVSDALKRCAVCFGVGAQLYELGPGQGHPTAEVIAQAARSAGWRGEVSVRSSNGAPPPPRGASPEPPPRPAPPRPSSPAANEDTRALGAMLVEAYHRVHGSQDRERVASDLSKILGCKPEETYRLSAEQMRRCIEVLKAEDDEAAPLPESPEEQDSDPLATHACSMPNCGKRITEAERDVSMRAFGRILCRACSRKAARTA